jgi:hypothetical protein
VDGPSWAHFENVVGVPPILPDTGGDLSVAVHRPAGSSTLMATVSLRDLLALLKLREYASIAAGRTAP